ncbi:MAG: GYD domain-containing protein [Ktedonobacterales bacterium]
MPTYVTLFKWTDEGAKIAKETVNRADRGTELAQKLGGKVLGIYWTQGEYDVVTISEWPDEDAAEAFLLQTASSGGVRTQTLRAFTADDMRRILGKLG